MKIPSKFPFVVKRGAVRVTIYRTPRGGYDSFTLAYHDGPKLRRRRFSSFDLAKREADLTAAKLVVGELDALMLTGKDRAAYSEAIRLLNPTGVALTTAVERYTRAHAALGGISLDNAVEFYLTRNPRRLERKSVKHVVEEMLRTKKSAGRSRVYVSDLRYRCGKFAEAFRCDIQSIDRKQIEEYLSSLKLSPRSRNNFFLALRTMFRFAVSRKYLAKDFEELDGIERFSQPNGKIEIFTPSEVRRLLSVVRAEMIPFVAIGAFAGLRHAELCRLEWSEIDLEAGFIEVTAIKSKTKSRRLVPISANLARWLLTCPVKSGKVVPFRCVGDQIVELCKSTEEVDENTEKVVRPATVWKRNGLRHSFVSYRIALTQNVNQVALEAGNSPGIIDKNYRELVRPKVAQEWFSIIPEEVSNLITVEQIKGRFLSPILHHKLAEKR